MAVRTDATADDPGEAQANRVADKSVSLPTVLIVDDEPTLLDLLGSFLRENGYHVRTARSGEEALDKLAREDAAAVVLDLGLPGIDGFEVCRRARASSNYV